MPDLRDWPALVLTAGLATRLRPLSAIRAKAAMPVAGTPLIGRILQWLRAQGVSRVVMNLHHRPETITSVVGEGAHYGLAVRYSWEPTLLGSAGGVRKALPLLDAERFLIVNGDTLTDCDLRAVASRHLEVRARVTLAVVEGDVHRYGGVLVGSDDAVRGFGRATDDTRARHFIGVQAVDASVFAHLSDAVPSETVGQLYPALIAGDPQSITVAESDAEFLDIGTARDYLATVAKVAAREGRPYDVGENVQIAPDATATRSILWDGVVLDAGSQVTDCIVADGVRVPAGACYERCVLTNGGHLSVVRL